MKVIDGWPCISDTLRWAEGCPLYLMGQYSALQVGLLQWFCLHKYSRSQHLLFSSGTQVGPHAVNLAGGQAASMRIAKDIVRRQQGIGEEEGEKAKTEEYIQQMQGLFWL